jgi:ABC-2 type transport system ATP-binding protein
MDEAQALADRVSIINHGRIVVERTPHELIDQMGADTIRITGRGESTGFLEKVRPLPFVQAVNASERFIQIGVDSGNRRLVEVVSLAQNNSFTIEDISVTKPSLGDVFLKYTGRQLRDT